MQVEELELEERELADYCPQLEQADCCPLPSKVHLGKSEHKLSPHQYWAKICDSIPGYCLPHSLPLL